MKKSILPLLLIVISIFCMSSVIAKQPVDWEGYAYGTITNYDDAPSASIVSGFWNLKILDDKVWLNVYYIEKNTIGSEENSPDSSIDLFEITLIGKPMAMYTDDNDRLHIFAQIQIKKMWATYDGTYEPKMVKTWNDFIFDFDEGWVLIDGYPPDSRGDPPSYYPPEDTVVSGEPWTYDWDINGIITDTDLSY